MNDVSARRGGDFDFRAVRIQATSSIDGTPGSLQQTTRICAPSSPPFT
jgi:hypothetical protein